MFSGPDFANETTVLVTGGGGYIGSHVILQLIRAGLKRLIAIDNFSNCYDSTASPSSSSSSEAAAEKPDSLKRVEQMTGSPVKFYRVDVTNFEQLNNVFSQHSIDCVIHLAAAKSVSESCQNPLKYYRNNVSGTITLLDAMTANGVNKLVFSSSATVYGRPEFLPITEKHPIGNSCTNPYGKSKFMIEEILKDLCSSNRDWQVISLRYFNPVGADKSGLIGEDPKDIPNNLMPFIAQVAVGRREKLRIFGCDYDTEDGTGVRDYIHITDLSAGHYSAVEKLFTDFRGYAAVNLGTGQGHSVLAVRNMFCEVSGQQIDFEMSERRDGDLPALFANADYAKEFLGWTATRDLREMCTDMWNWQTKNPNGYHPID